MSHTRVQKRRADVRRRAGDPSGDYVRCRVIGCPNSPTSTVGQGLNRLYCRRHEEHYARHGSYFKGSYSAAQIRPHRKAALEWLRAHERDLDVRHARDAVVALYRSAGPHREAFRLAGLSPEDRARAAWARLREAKVDPLEPIAAWLAIGLAILADPQPERKIEFRRVQAAKLVHRMASGTHKRWEQDRPGGRKVVVQMHRYPASRGRILRHLGEQLERAAELLGMHRLREIRPVQRRNRGAA